jgi:hypothetical protein
MASVYDYEKRHKIIIYDRPDLAGMAVAEVVVGVTSLHKGTPFGCLCWLANNGDKKARRQLAIWRQGQKAKASREGQAITQLMGRLS